MKVDETGTAGQRNVSAINEVPRGISALPNSLGEGPKLNSNQQICWASFPAS